MIISTPASFNIQKSSQRQHCPNINERIALMMPQETATFTKDWFSQNIPQWQELLGSLAGKPRLRFLEIGVLEGRATVWLLSNILTEPTSRIICMDTFEGSMEHQSGKSHSFDALDSLYQTFSNNVAPYKDRVRIKIGKSQELSSP